MASSGARTLIATNRFSDGSSALRTTPIPPRPMTSTTSYGPDPAEVGGVVGGGEEVERVVGFRVVGTG